MNYGATRQEENLMDGEKENMQRVGVSKDDASDRVRWRQIIQCSDS